MTEVILASEFQAIKSTFIETEQVGIVITVDLYSRDGYFESWPKNPIF
jgi:hypothetical protein